MTRSTSPAKAKPRGKKPYNDTVIDLAKLGDGTVAYIKVMTSEQAHEAFPAIENLPKGINLFCLHGADGTPLALTDSLSGAIGHAKGDELEVRQLN